MDRCTVLIDAGYVVNAAMSTTAAQRCHGRASIEFATLIGDLVDQAETRTNSTLLRVYWYSPWPQTHSTDDLKSLELLPHVKVRVGAGQGEINDQAGVSAHLQRDLLTLARNHAVGDIVILTADQNLLTAIEEAQSFGVRVHLWGIHNNSGLHGQSHAMMASADCHIAISSAWIGQFVTDSADAPASTEAAITSTVADLMPIEPVDNSEPLRVGSLNQPPPLPRRDEVSNLIGTHQEYSEQALLSGSYASAPSWEMSASDTPILDSLNQASGYDHRLSLSEHNPARSDRMGSTAVLGEPPSLERPSPVSLSFDSASEQYDSGPTATISPDLDFARSDDEPFAIARLADITSPQEAEVDQMQDDFEYGVSADRAGMRFGSRWARRASRAQFDTLVTRYRPPDLPRSLASELAEYAESVGVESRDPVVANTSLTLSFWAAIAEAGHDD